MWSAALKVAFAGYTAETCPELPSGLSAAAVISIARPELYRSLKTFQVAMAPWLQFHVPFDLENWFEDYPTCISLCLGARLSGCPSLSASLLQRSEDLSKRHFAEHASLHSQAHLLMAIAYLLAYQLDHCRHYLAVVLCYADTATSCFMLPEFHLAGCMKLLFTCQSAERRLLLSRLSDTNCSPGGPICRLNTLLFYVQAEILWWQASLGSKDRDNFLFQLVQCLGEADALLVQSEAVKPCAASFRLMHLYSSAWVGTAECYHGSPVSSYLGCGSELRRQPRS
jgi:hypothetical protein